MNVAAERRSAPGGADAGHGGGSGNVTRGLAALIGLPGFDIVRPANAQETAVAWRRMEVHSERPAGIALNRGSLPVFARPDIGNVDDAARGAYVLVEAGSGAPEVILIAVGPLVQVAADAAIVLEMTGVPTRVVSMPCWQWFLEEAAPYHQSVLPPAVSSRVSVDSEQEPVLRTLVGDRGECLTFPTAARPDRRVPESRGLAEELIVAAARRSARRYAGA